MRATKPPLHHNELHWRRSAQHIQTTQVSNNFLSWTISLSLKRVILRTTSRVIDQQIVSQMFRNHGCNETNQCKPFWPLRKKNDFNNLSFCHHGKKITDFFDSLFPYQLPLRTLKIQPTVVCSKLDCMLQLFLQQ